MRHTTVLFAIIIVLINLVVSISQQEDPRRFRVHRQRCTGKCGKDRRGNCIPSVQCLKSPCSGPYTEEEQRCLDRYRGDAKCVDNYCGSCKRFFVVDGYRVCQHVSQDTPTDQPQSCGVCNRGKECSNGQVCCCGKCRSGPCNLACTRNPCGDQPVEPQTCNLCNGDNAGCPGGKTCCGCGTNGTCKDGPCMLRCAVGPCDQQNSNVLKEGDSCTLSGSRGMPVVPCGKNLFCEITDAGRPAVDYPNSGTCSKCAPYTVCRRDSECRSLGKYFQCVKTGGCVSSSCGLGEDCEPTVCTKDCRTNVGVCKQVLPTEGTHN